MLSNQYGKIQKAKNFKEKSNFAGESIVLPLLGLCKHWAFP